MKSSAPFLQPPRRRAFPAIRPTCLVASFVVLILFAACSEERQKPAETLITVNGFTVSKDEFNQLLKFEAEVNPAFHLSQEERGQFLRQLIEKQLLIQEARTRKLDEQEQFRQTIQRYWESTLIRDLLNNQGEAIRRGVVVTEEEIAAWHQAHKEDLPDQPLAEQRHDIRRAVENEKVDTAMRQWLDGLRGKARIDIADPELRNEASLGSHRTSADVPDEVK